MGRHYQTFNYSGSQLGGKTLITGIRGVQNSSQVYISGVYVPPNSNQPTGLIYKGCLSGKGVWYTLNYPNSKNITVTGTSLYGPNSLKDGLIQVVGNYTSQETGQVPIGCLYIGNVNGKGKWTTLLPPSPDHVIGVIAHSTMGGLVVGNYDTDLITGKAFLYDIKTNQYYDLTHPHAKSITAYGIWHNQKDSYTICGGYIDTLGVTYGYIAHWDNKIHKLSNFKGYVYGNDPAKAKVTHFDGITTDGKGGYNLTGDYVDFDDNSHAFFAHSKKAKEAAEWETIKYPGSDNTSGNTVYKTAVLGIYTTGDANINGYVSY